MKVLIDGKEVEVLNDVKIIYDNQFVDEDMEQEGHLQVTANSEGIVLDACDEAGEVVQTTWMMPETLIEYCH